MLFSAPFRRKNTLLRPFLHVMKKILQNRKLFAISLVFSPKSRYTAPSETGRRDPLITRPNRWLQDCAVAGLAVVMGLSYALFVFPNAFAPAGLNGFATIIQYLFHISIGYLSLLVNIPLILLAWRKLDADFAKKSLLFVLVFSATTLLLGHIDLSGIAYDSGASSILGPAAAGVVSGAVYGLVIRLNGSTGGTDIVAAWVHKWHPEVSLVWLIFGLNASVAVLSFFVYGYQFEPVILCLLYCYLSSRISDSILKGGKRALKFEVITQHPEELADKLLKELHHGVTVIPAEGMFSKTPKYLLICVVNRHQIVRFQNILRAFPDTFAYMSDVNETLGNFKHIA